MSSQLKSSMLTKYCSTNLAAEKILEQLFAKKSLSARGYHRILKTARTIADLDHSDRIMEQHITEAAMYRPDELLA